MMTSLEQRLLSPYDNLGGGIPGINNDPLYLPGLQTKEDFQFGYNLPGQKDIQLHLHGPDPTTISHGRYKDNFGNYLGDNLTGYQASMASLYLDNLGAKKYP